MVFCYCRYKDLYIFLQYFIAFVNIVSIKNKQDKEQKLYHKMNLKCLFVCFLVFGLLLCLFVDWLIRSLVRSFVGSCFRSLFRQLVDSFNCRSIGLLALSIDCLLAFVRRLIM